VTGVATAAPIRPPEAARRRCARRLATRRDPAASRAASGRAAASAPQRGKRMRRADPAPVQITAARADAVAAPRPPLVAVIDDDPSVRESLPDLLTTFGFSVRAFASAEGFLASDCVVSTDCLILDIAMPGMTGPELQAELARRHRPPIVFITAHADAALRSRLIDAGAVDCLSKPFDEDSLLAALNVALGRRP